MLTTALFIRPKCINIGTLLYKQNGIHQKSFSRGISRLQPTKHVLINNNLFVKQNHVFKNVVQYPLKTFHYPLSRLCTQTTPPPPPPQARLSPDDILKARKRLEVVAEETNLIFKLSTLFFAPFSFDRWKRLTMLAPSPVTFGIIALCDAIWLASFVMPGPIAALATSATQVWSGSYYTIFTAAFMHWNYFHLSMNMAALLAFARPIEIQFGPWILLLVLLLTIAFSMLFQMGVGSNDFMRDYKINGISGGICGALGFTAATLIKSKRADGLSPLSREGRLHLKLIIQRMRPSATFGAILSLVAFSILSNMTGLPIANAAHFSGLLLGASMGMCYNWGLVPLLGCSLGVCAGLVGLAHPETSNKYRAWKGVNYLSEGKYEEAVYYLEKVVRSRIHDPWGRAVLALAYSQLPNQWEKSREIASSVDMSQLIDLDGRFSPEFSKLPYELKKYPPWAFINAKYTKDLFVWLFQRTRPYDIADLVPPVKQDPDEVNKKVAEIYSRTWTALKRKVNIE